MLTINLAVLLAIIVVLRLKRPVEPRKRTDQALTVAIVVVLGVLIAPTDFGHWIHSFVGQVVTGVTAASH